jgi:putative membrane protein
MSLIGQRETPANRETSVLKGLAAGTIGGLVGSWVMDKFQAAWFKASRVIEEPQGNSPKEIPSLQGAKVSSKEKQQEPATFKAAEVISAGVFDHELEEHEKKLAGDVVHYAVGSASGAIYGAAAELTPEVTAGAGIPFGSAVWLVVDEGAVPILGFSKGPTEYPLSTHVYALASHFVFGLTTEVVRRALRRTILR